MNSQWKSFLQTQVTTAGHEGGALSGHIGEHPGCTLTDLSHLGLIGVGGEDAETFLQGQVTNDVRNITDNRFQISACCTPKGRIQASFIAFRHQQEIMLQLPRDTQQMLLKRLPMFILMSKVKVADASDKLVCIGLLGDHAQTLLQTQFSRVPANAWDAVQEKKLTLLRHPGATPRFEIIGAPAAMMVLWKELAVSATPDSSERWMLEDIRAGIPTIHAATSESFLPQMTNMQLIGGVSFTKGCYTGQEVVARTKYLGKIKRRMYLARINSDLCPLPGEELFSTGSESGQGTGKVVDAQHSPDGGCELLAVIEIARHDDDDVHIGGVDGEKLCFQALPYRFEQD